MAYFVEAIGKDTKKVEKTIRNHCVINIYFLANAW